MRIAHPFFKKIPRNALLIIFVLFMLSACDAREVKLSEREARISARESELVTLFAELVEQKKLLEKNQSDQLSNIKEDSDANKSSNCFCDAKQEEPSEKEQSAKTATRTILGGLEHAYLDPPGMEFSARIDTGAQTSSLNALDIVEFERDGKPYVKFNILHPQTKEKLQLTRRLRRYVRVKELGNKESQRRPVVRMRVVLANIDERINFTLENRSRFKHQVLIGRNFLQDLAIVDVSKKYTKAKADKPESATIK